METLKNEKGFNLSCFDEVSQNVHSRFEMTFCQNFRDDPIGHRIKALHHLNDIWRRFVLVASRPSLSSVN